MTCLHWVGVAAVIALVVLWGWLAWKPRVRSAVYRHGGWWYREWRRPYVTAVTSADRRYGLALNRYVDHIVIGVALYVGHRGLSLVWARPRYDRDPSFDDWTDQALELASHTDAAMRRLEYCPECVRTHAHASAEEAADCVKCHPSSLPRRIEDGGEQ